MYVYARVLPAVKQHSTYMNPSFSEVMSPVRLVVAAVLFFPRLSGKDTGLPTRAMQRELFAVNKFMISNFSALRLIRNLHEPLKTDHKFRLRHEPLKLLTDHKLIIH